MLRIVAGTYEGLLYGWEFPTKASLKAPSPKLKLIFGYSAHTECIKSVALMAAKHGKTLLSGGNDEMIKIYNVDKRVEVGSLMEQHGAITSLEFFGQSHLLSGSADNSICIWRASDWNCLHILGGHKGEINSIAVHPSGKLCFSVARDRTLRMWNLVKGRIAYIRRLEQEANLVMLSQKGTRYALCFGSDLSVFSSANAELVGTLEHKQRIQCAVFATDDYVVCGGDDKYIYVWKTSGDLVAKVTHPEITARIRCTQVLYVNGEDELPWIVIATSNGAVQIWDLATFKFDALAPEESNASVAPVTSTLLLSKPRLTCLTACLADEGIAMPAPKKEKKIAKKAATKPAATKAETAAAPRVVVELDDEKPDTKQQKKMPDTKQQQQKRKANDSKQKQGKKKAKKHAGWRHISAVEAARRTPSQHAAAVAAPERAGVRVRHGERRAQGLCVCVLSYVSPSSSLSLFVVERSCGADEGSCLCVADDDGECKKDDEIRKLQARLRAFFWAHDPRQVDKVDEILERHKGKEEAFIQRLHMQFGERDFSGEIAIDDIYEHERYSYFSFSYGSSFPGHLLPTDRRRWSGLHGTPSSQTREKVEPQLPVNWVWTSSWEIDTESGNCDSDGWTYAFDFTMMNHALKRNGGRKEPRSTDYVRRRRWIRRRQRVVRTNALPSTARPLHRAHTAPPQELEVGDSDDDADDTGAPSQQIEAAATDLNIDDDDGGAGDGDGGYDEDDEGDELQGNNQEDALSSPPLSVSNSDRSKLPSLSLSLQSALRPPAQTDQKSAIEAHPLQIFHMDMEKSATDAAWNLAVKELETMYTRAKNHEAAKKKQWCVKREKMLRQIHLLEKMIASMQAVAQEEERKRRASASASSSPRGKASFSLQSPNGGGNLRSPGMDNLKSPRAAQHAAAKNAVNVINLAAKMKCAQSKLDALKRLFWHPREKKYTLRFSIDGIFYGLRDFFVETFKSSFHISMNHQTNGAQGITPTCKIVMKGHTVCCGKHVKVTGDKGTRVPKSIWERMYLDTDFEASIYLIYVEDMSDDASTKLRSGNWEFLFNPESTRVELINFTRRVNGGLDLPEPVVRKLCSDVLSSLVRDLALIYFPQEFAIAFDVPPAKLDLEGELEITGLPIDDVIEREIECINDMTPEPPTPSASSAQEETSSKSNLVIAAATQLLSSFLRSDVYMKRIAAALNLSPAQFNLLVALKECGLYPAPYSFKTIATMCEYYATFFIEEKVASGEDDHIEKLRMVWKQVLELLYIRKMKAAAAGRGTPFAATAQASSNGNGKGCSAFALFSMDDFFDTIARLTKKPVALQMTVKRLHCSVNALSVVEAVSKLYERLILGVDFSKPRTGYESFMYGFRFGRKATVSTAVASGVADATTPKNGASAMLPLDPRLHVQMDAVFRARLKAFSQFFRSLKALLEFVKQNMDHVNAEMVGSLKGSGTDCDVNGSFKDVEYVGPVNAAIGVPTCFLGLYKIEIVALDEDRVGLQVELMLPKAEATHQKRLRGKSATMSALESVCKFVVSDLSTQVMIDMDALLEDHRSRTASDAAEITAPWSPTKSFARKVETQKTNQQHRAFSFSFESNATANELLTSGDKISVTKVKSATNLNADGSSPFGKLKVAASAFTKLHTNVKSGSFTTRVVPILNWFIAKQLRPLVLKSFSEHIVLFDSVVASFLQWISSAQMELDFDVLAKAFLHNRDNDLMLTFCGSPLHPTPIVYKDELFLLPLILHVDDLVNLWIDDRYPPYANPLYF